MVDPKEHIMKEKKKKKFYVPAKNFHNFNHRSKDLNQTQSRGHDQPDRFVPDRTNQKGSEKIGYNQT